MYLQLQDVRATLMQMATVLMDLHHRTAATAHLASLKLTECVVSFNFVNLCTCVK